jgi:hypothetical protein
MIPPSGEAVGGFRQIIPFTVQDERQGVTIRLGEGFEEGLQDDLGRRFTRSLYFEFANNRIWIPCFISWEVFEFEYRGSLQSGQYMNIYCVPRDVADWSFRSQYADIFGGRPDEAIVEQFWSDIGTAMDLFLKYARELYERSVPDPRPPRFILFEWGGEVSNWLHDFQSIAASALKLIQEARVG